MTELAVERLAGVPDKLHIALLEMLGIELRPPAPARADVRFRLSAPTPRPVGVRAGTEIGTVRTATEESIVFQVRGRLHDRPAAACGVRDRARRRGQGDRSRGRRRAPARARPDPVRAAARSSGTRSTSGSSRASRGCSCRSRSRPRWRAAPGVRPEDPPLRWEASQGARRLDGGRGARRPHRRLQLRLRERSSSNARPARGWSRSRAGGCTGFGAGSPRRRASAARPPPTSTRPRSTGSPPRRSARCSPPSTRRSRSPSRSEPSDGAPGETFTLRFAPVVSLAPGETLEVQTPEGDWEPWEEVDSFADSGPNDRHFTIDLVHGVIRLGPELHDPDGGVVRHGASPPKGAALRMSRYRHGGGRIGNLAPDSLTTLRSAIPGVASVTNPHPARGGVDPQSLDRHAQRARARDPHAPPRRDRAGLRVPRHRRPRPASRGRCGCRTVEPGVTLGILPRIDPANRRLTIDELTPDQNLLETVARHLNARKVAGLPAPARAGALARRIGRGQPRGFAARRRRADRARSVRRALRLPEPTDRWKRHGPERAGRSGVRSTRASCTRSSTQWRGSQSVRILRLYEVDLHTGQRAAKPAGRQIALAPDELIASGEHIVRVVRRET